MHGNTCLEEALIDRCYQVLLFQNGIMDAPELLAMIKKDPITKQQLHATLKGMREALSSASAAGGTSAGWGTGGASALHRPDAPAAALPSPVDQFEDAVSAALISAKAAVASERLLGDPISCFPLAEIEPQPLLPSHSNGQELQVKRRRSA